VEKYRDRDFQILGFPCNQFGLQENFKNEDILPLLEFVRPGHGYKPRFPLTQRVHVNGEDAHPLFKWLKEAVSCVVTENDRMMTDERPRWLNTGPVGPNDVRWNFETFLIDKEGRRIKRYAPLYHFKDLSPDIDEFLEAKPSSK